MPRACRSDYSKWGSVSLTPRLSSCNHQTRTWRLNLKSTWPQGIDLAQ